MVFAQNVFWAMTGNIVRRVRGIQAEMNDRQSVVCYESISQKSSKHNWNDQTQDLDQVELTKT